jgi:hypothetical protein
MKCPDEICGREINDDSFFCHFCGQQIGHCAKCGIPSMAEYCSECGGEIVYLADDPPCSEAADSEAVETENVRGPEPVEPPPPQPDSGAGGTITVHKPRGNEIRLRSDKYSWELLIEEKPDGEIIGRSEGSFAAVLKDFGTISGRHAKVFFENGCWYIMDIGSNNTGSTNGTYVNNTRIPAQEATPIKQNDVVGLADLTCYVRKA